MSGSSGSDRAGNPSAAGGGSGHSGIAVALRLDRLDAWMAAHPWHARLLPFAVYVYLFLPLVAAARDWRLWTYPVLYGLQCLVTAWLLWRYRRLTPELNLRFHWAALPVGVAVCALWIVAGLGMERAWPRRFAPGDPHYFTQMPPALFWTSALLRLLGMSIVVPLMEELFIRSLLLRSFHHGRAAGRRLLHMLEDLPLLGDWIMHSRWGDAAAGGVERLGSLFARTPLGALSLCGVGVSTLVFTLHHVPRDWAGCVLCALAYCGLLAATRHRGLGPVVWAHGITNALLWAWSLAYADWRFL